MRLQYLMGGCWDYYVPYTLLAFHHDEFQSHCEEDCGLRLVRPQ